MLTFLQFPFLKCHFSRIPHNIFISLSWTNTRKRKTRGWWLLVVRLPSIVTVWGDTGVEEPFPSKTATFQCCYYHDQFFHAGEQHHHINKPPWAHKVWLWLNRNSVLLCFRLRSDFNSSSFLFSSVLSLASSTERYRASLALNHSLCYVCFLHVWEMESETNSPPSQ